MNYDKDSKSFRIESSDGTIPPFPFNSEKFAENYYDVSKSTSRATYIPFESFIFYSYTIAKQVVLEDNSLIVRLTHNATDDTSFPETLQYAKVFTGMRIN